jgi:hypothetical protein
VQITEKYLSQKQSRFFYVINTHMLLNSLWQWRNWSSVPCRVPFIDCNWTKSAQVSAADIGLLSLLSWMKK